MKGKWTWILVGVIGLVIGVGLASWRSFPTEDMIARTTCAECHDVHGAIEFSEAPAQSQVWILGDVPESTYFFVSDLFPYASQTADTSISLVELLADYGVTDWQRVAIESLDGGIVTFEREYVTDESLLVPYVEGIRFKDANQHESTWLKGVRWITVQGTETALIIGDEATSMGRMLFGERVTVVAEGGDAIFNSPLDGEIYRGDYAHTYTGASLRPLLEAYSDAADFSCTDADGNVVVYTRDELAEALIAPVEGVPSLVLPQFGRGRWIIGVRSVIPTSGVS